MSKTGPHVRPFEGATYPMLPPEPEPDFGAPPEEPPAYTRDDEERDMMEAAQSTGEMDHRSATEVAMELLERELGARRA